MDRGQELLQEEQLETLKSLRTEIGELKVALSNELSVKQSNNPDKMEVSGAVQVNTEKEVAITNIEDFTSGLDVLGELVTKAIKDNAHKPLEEVKITNIEKAIAKEMKISNFSELADELRAVKQAILDSKSVVNVEKQDIVFPTDPKRPIAVRLSDGKSFYTAMTAAVSSGVNTSGLATTTKQDEIIAAIGGIGTPVETADNVIMAYNASDSDIIYIGEAVNASSQASAVWKITRLDLNSLLSVTYADGNINYDNVWNNRESLTYT